MAPSAGQIHRTTIGSIPSRDRTLVAQFASHEQPLLNQVQKFIEAINNNQEPPPTNFYVRGLKTRNLEQQQDLKEEGTVARSLHAVSSGGGSDVQAEFPIGDVPGANQYIQVLSAKRRVTRTSKPSYIVTIKEWKPIKSSTPYHHPDLRATNPRNFILQTTELLPNTAHAFIGSLIGASTVADQSRMFAAGNSDTNAYRTNGFLKAGHGLMPLELGGVGVLAADRKGRMEARGNFEIRNATRPVPFAGKPRTSIVDDPFAWKTRINCQQAGGHGSAYRKSDMTEVQGVRSLVQAAVLSEGSFGPSISDQADLVNKKTLEQDCTEDVLVGMARAATSEIEYPVNVIERAATWAETAVGHLEASLESWGLKSRIAETYASRVMKNPRPVLMRSATIFARCEHRDYLAEGDLQRAALTFKENFVEMFVENPDTMVVKERILPSDDDLHRTDSYFGKSKEIVQQAVFFELIMSGRLPFADLVTRVFERPEVKGENLSIPSIEEAVSEGILAGRLIERPDGTIDIV